MPTPCEYCLYQEDDEEIEVHYCDEGEVGCWGSVCNECCWISNGRAICPNCHIHKKQTQKSNNGDLIECVMCGGQGEVFVPDEKDYDSQGPGLNAYRVNTGFNICDNCDGTGKVNHHQSE